MDTLPGEIIYMAYFVYDQNFETNAFMISSKNALTSAHYLKSFFLDCPPPDFTKYFIVVNGYLHGLKKEHYEIEQVEHISGFDPREPNLSFDIAVIKVDHYLYIFILFKIFKNFKNSIVIKINETFYIVNNIFFKI